MQMHFALSAWTYCQAPKRFSKKTSQNIDDNRLSHNFCLAQILDTCNEQSAPLSSAAAVLGPALVWLQHCPAAAEKPSKQLHCTVKMQLLASAENLARSAALHCMPLSMLMYDGLVQCLEDCLGPVPGIDPSHQAAFVGNALI